MKDKSTWNNDKIRLRRQIISAIIIEKLLGITVSTTTTRTHAHLFNNRLYNPLKERQTKTLQFHLLNQLTIETLKRLGYRIILHLKRHTHVRFCSNAQTINFNWKKKETRKFCFPLEIKGKWFETFCCCIVGQSLIMCRGLEEIVLIFQKYSFSIWILEPANILNICRYSIEMPFLFLLRMKVKHSTVEIDDYKFL